MMHFGRKTALLGAGMFLFANGAFAAPGALGGGLSQLVQRWENGDPNLSQVLALHLTSRGGDPLVKLHVVDGVTPSQVLPELSALGFRLTATSSLDNRLIEGFLPLAAARAAVRVPGVETIRSQFKPHANAGLAQSQAVALQKADLAQARGFTGAGIKLAALSDSFDACARCRTHAAQDVASGDLSPVTVLQEDFDPGTDEGRAMLQLAHDIAPGAQLGFASAFNGEVQFAENIIGLRAAFGADVIVDDVIYFDEPMFSDGIVAQAADFVHDSGGAYFSSSMNNGIEAFESDYQAVSFAKAQALEAAGATNLKLEQIPANAASAELPQLRVALLAGAQPALHHRGRQHHRLPVGRALQPPQGEDRLQHLHLRQQRELARSQHRADGLLHDRRQHRRPTRPSSLPRSFPSPARSTAAPTPATTSSSSAR